MPERPEEPEANIDTTVDQPSPAAMALALGRSGRANKRLDAKAERFLDKQSRLIDLQTEHLHEQRTLILSRLRWGRYSDRMRALLQTLTVLVGLAVAAAVVILAWSAHEDHGLVVEPFSVPPDLAARGLSGQVVASRVLDRLSDLQVQTVSGRPGSSYADDWGDDIKVEIPETGVSVGDLNRYLRQWLGHETQVTGEIVHTASGVSVTARAAGQAGKTITGAEADIDRLVDQAAETIYAQTQPYRYAVYLQAHGRPDLALATYMLLAQHGSAQDRIWAYSGWSELLIERGDNAGAERVLRAAVAREGLALFASGALANLNTAEGNLRHIQGELDAMRLSLRAAQRTGDGNAFVSNPVALRILRAAIAELTGDLRSAVAGWSAVSAMSVSAEGGQVALLPHVAQAEDMIADHDVSGGQKLLAGTPSAASAFSSRALLTIRVDAMRQTEAWRELAAELHQAQAADEVQGAIGRDQLERFVWPNLAIAEARLGGTADAGALAAATPLDCDPCLDARAQVAALNHDWTGANRWFAMLERRTPDIPTYDTDWGQAVMAKGDLDGAIAKLKQAHHRGPHFADPLEVWGEALMAKRDYDGAISKFAEADRDAPRWGRNHLRWGEALMLLGRYGEARAQYQAANGLDLSKPDRVALDVLLARTAKGLLHG